ncbi:MarR family winged helix-turn-helix transcriptional regulator [Fodinicurvata halophila]|uniref:MarR family winged helix-turn-helix transcriptional regulator n=1 Tax=Fodinicurvata halophila TaxID=1419723 RepID=A0ABV8UJG9_9PROT
MKAAYLDMIRMIERLHRQCLELVKAEIEREGIRDLNNVQALILFNIGEGEVTVGELTQRGYYLGSNVSYNVKKLVENGYLVQERSPHDRRSTHVRVSDKGLAIYKHMDRLFEHHAEAMSEAGLSEEDLNGASDILSRLLRYWSGPEHFSGRGYPGA